jgi:hypothetical protein
MKKLRKRTIEVEEFSLKIDELQNKNDDLELLIKKIDSFDRDIFEESRKNKTI